MPCKSWGTRQLVPPDLRRFAQNIGYLVVMWACVEMAPPDLEGTTLALATTIGNAGQRIYLETPLYRTPLCITHHMY